MFIILSAFDTPERRAEREKIQQDHQDSDRRVKDQEERDKPIRDLMNAGKAMDEYKRVHGHYPD